MQSGYEPLIRASGTVIGRGIELIKQRHRLSADARDLLAARDSLKQLIGLSQVEHLAERPMIGPEVEATFLDPHGGLHHVSGTVRRNGAGKLAVSSADGTETLVPHDANVDRGMAYVRRQAADWASLIDRSRPLSTLVWPVAKRLPHRFHGRLP